MKVIYVAGPFRGKTAWDVECNIRRAEELALAVSRVGAMPMCPHTNTRFFNGEGQFWLDGTMELLRRCDAVVLTHDWERSSGARAEVAEAERIGLPVFLGAAELNDWLQLTPGPSGMTKPQAISTRRDARAWLKWAEANQHGGSCACCGCLLSRALLAGRSVAGMPQPG